MGRTSRKDRPDEQTARARPGLETRGPHKSPAPVVCGLLLLAVVAVFGQTVRHDFVNFDDGQYVRENAHVTQGLTVQAVVWAFTRSHSYNWHPLTWISHMVDCQLFGLWAGGHHLTNVVLHGATSVLLLLVLRSMTGRLWPSALVAAVFAVHPLRVESVAWVAERKDVLSGLFFVLTLAAYSRYASRPFSLAGYLSVVVLFGLGLMAKPMLVTLPALLLLLDYWPLERLTGPPANDGNPWRRARRLVVEKIPLLAMAAASCAVTLRAQREAILPMDKVPLPWRLANAVVAYADYLVQFVYPARLAVLYPHPGDDLSGWTVAAALLVLLAISAVAVALARKCPYLIVGWLWYLGTLVPVIGLVQVGVQAMADRYTYLTQIGLTVAVVWSLAAVLPARRGRRCAWSAGVAVVLAMLATGAWRQASYWRDGESLWRRTLACTSRNCVAHANLGLALLRKNRHDEAIEEYRKAADANPNYAEAYLNIGVALRARGRNDEAIEYYEKAMRIRPEYAEAQYNYGNAMFQKGRIGEAIACYEEAVRLKPDCADAHYNLATALEGSGRSAEAVPHYEQVLTMEPDNDQLHQKLGTVLQGLGRSEEALSHYRRALDMATARGDAAMADAVRARIRLCPGGATR